MKGCAAGSEALKLYNCGVHKLFDGAAFMEYINTHGRRGAEHKQEIKMLKMTDTATGTTITLEREDRDLAGNLVTADRWMYRLLQNDKPMGRSVSAAQAAAMVAKARADGRAVIEGAL
jgi:hypothetical protein